MLTPDFQVGRPVGTGHSRPNDVIRLRRALNETGHGSSPPDPSGVYDPSLIGSIERFQRDYGLKQDGIVLPGGPTERMLNVALAAQRQGGDDGQAQLRQMVSAITNSGLKPEAPPPGDNRPIAFADPSDRIATPDQVAQIIGASLKHSPSGRSDRATLASTATTVAGGANQVFRPTAPRALASLAEAGAALAELEPIGWVALAALVGSDYADRWGKAHPEYLAQKQSERDAVAASIADLNARQRARRDANGARRTIDTEASPTILPGTPPHLPPHIPTPPLTHPPVPHENEPEIFPIVEDGPQLLPGPQIEPAKPEKMIYEVLPDDEFWRRLSILERAGNPDTRMLNHRLAERAAAIAKEMGVKLNVIFGGYDENGKYRREGYMRPKGDLLVPDRPTLNGSYLDIGLQDEATKTNIYINTTDNYANGELKPREARQVHKVNINKEDGDMFTTVPKPRGKGVDPEEYVKQFDGLFRDIIKKLKQ